MFYEIVTTTWMEIVMKQNRILMICLNTVSSMFTAANILLEPQVVYAMQALTNCIAMPCFRYFKGSRSLTGKNKKTDMPADKHCPPPLAVATPGAVVM